MKKFLLPAFLCLLPALGNAQSFYRSPNATILGNNQSIYDTITVSNLTQSALNGTFGLDSVSLKLNYGNDEDLVISLIAPDGAVVRLAENLGGSGNNFSNTRFTMNVSNLVNDESAPFTGDMRPEGWLGRVNNGQVGNGKWVLHILNMGTNNTTGTLIKWGVHFDNTPSPQEIFTSSNLPIVSVNTNDVVIPWISEDKVYGTMGIVYNGFAQTNYTTSAFNNYSGNISIKVRGSSSAGFPTKSYTIETEDAAGANNNVSLLGMPADNDWILYAPWDDKSLLRDVLTYRLSNDMGEYASRTRMVELMLNGDYKGVYVLEEKIKQAPSRVNVHKMTSSDISGDAVTGGYVFEVDRNNGEGWQSNYTFCDASTGKPYFQYVTPKSSSIVPEQQTYIASYVDSFETALKTVDVYDTVNGYRHYINVPTFIDQSMLQEISHNVDGYRLSSYLNKDRDGKLNGGPIWDINLGFGNADYYGGSDYSTFEWNLPCPFNDGNLNPFWWQKFLTDTNYYKELKCRYTALRTGAFDTVHIDYVIDSFVNVLQSAQARHYTRWPILGVYEWPEEYIGNTYTDEISYLKTWIQNRIGYMDGQLTSTNCTVSTAVAAVSPDIDVKLYPNPASDLVNISGSTYIKSITLYNMMGQKLYEGAVNSTRYALPLQQFRLASGIYNIDINTVSGTIRKKVSVVN